MCAATGGVDVPPSACELGNCIPATGENRQTFSDYRAPVSTSAHVALPQRCGRVLPHE